MTETIVKPDEKQQSEQKPAVSNDSPVEQGASPEILALRSRIKEEADKRRASDQKIAEYETKVEDDRKKDLEKRGEFETLLAEERSKREQAELKAKEWTSYESVKRDSLLEELPEDQRETYKGMSLSDLDSHVKNFTQTTQTKTTVKAPAEMGGYSSDLEFAIQDPEGYSKAKKGTGALSKFGNIFNPSGNN